MKLMIVERDVKLDIILKSGHIIHDVKSMDSTKNPVALWVWSTNQARDSILSFDKINVRASEIAAMVNTEKTNNKGLDKALNQLDNFQKITDDDLPF
jgi:hypothetical protein